MDNTDKASGWGCPVCGYIFTPGTAGVGGMENDPSRAFEVLPEDWACPECGSAKHRFKRLKREKDKKKH
jgi:rubredoxin